MPQRIVLTPMVAGAPQVEGAEDAAKQVVAKAKSDEKAAEKAAEEGAKPPLPQNATASRAQAGNSS